MDFSIGSSVPPGVPWGAIAVAMFCLAGAVVVRFRRLDRSQRAGCAEWVFLAPALLALLYVWDVYFPACPPGMWC